MTHRSTPPCPVCLGVKANIYAATCWTCYKKSIVNRVCTIEGCARPHCAKGLCHMHRDRKRLGIPDDVYVRGTSGFVRGVTFCSVDGCVRMTFNGRTGHCSMHATRVSTGGEVGAPGPVNAAKGKSRFLDWHTNHHGYVVRREYVDGAAKWVSQHRFVMEQMICRPLRVGENVHHVNGQRDDNRPENLELWSSAQPKGQRVVDKVAWAVEFLTAYAPELLK